MVTSDDFNKLHKEILLSFNSDRVNFGQRMAIIDGISKLWNEINELEDENTKLRELLIDTTLMPEIYSKKYNIECNFITCGKHWSNRCSALGITF